ncbi:MAG: GPP34 family phosphoprotein [Mycobacteriaceae bacterium]|nr:GPP34 family phosphoprotein [Mycobacteriaceae bacterium]MBV9638369.1 GPP34 family phosphoprotein [Mycobacteriaceae bacterium]
MAQITENLLLLLLDNATRKPALDRARRERVLGAAVLLDLALACRIRPAVDGEPVRAGRLLALAGPNLADPVLDPALQLLRRRPITPQSAIAKLRRGIEPTLLRQLERTGQIRPVRLRGKGLNRTWAWPLNDRTRVNQARAELLSALFDLRCPTPSTAAIISLLHAVDGLGALLSLNDRGWRWVHDRAGEIAGGAWVDESPARLAEVNLAVTTSVVRSALA